MIIQLESATAENAEAAKRSLGAIARSWGHEMAETPAGATTAAGTIHDDGKVIDPVSVAALVLSIPSAALAVLDLADRVRKRRRASELIDHARQLAARQVTVCVISRGRAVELRTPPDSFGWDLSDVLYLE
jgi:hypothetical protein